MSEEDVIESSFPPEMVARIVKLADQVRDFRDLAVLIPHATARLMKTTLDDEEFYSVLIARSSSPRGIVTSTLSSTALTAEALRREARYLMSDSDDSGYVPGSLRDYVLGISAATASIRGIPAVVVANYLASAAADDPTFAEAVEMCEQAIAIGAGDSEELRELVEECFVGESSPAATARSIPEMLEDMRLAATMARDGLIAYTRRPGATPGSTTTRH